MVKLSQETGSPRVEPRPWGLKAATVAATSTTISLAAIPKVSYLSVGMGWDVL